ncbi:hypothetical protein EE612_027755 [Oryza sativa]|nr:hypothetical protein EE612_027755 [Oryza sativa]
MGRRQSPGLELVAAEEMVRTATGGVEQGVGCGGAELAAEAGGTVASAERVAGRVERRRRRAFARWLAKRQGEELRTSGGGGAVRVLLLLELVTIVVVARHHPALRRWICKPPSRNGVVIRRLG